ncbi:E3 ubiquitin-protein ligase ATL59 [Cardamine amara subsp. amara]|uniref:RING-type E3 ubiquitin transferase n=1 Tax=Cardamine amara subsp. amara TaxID=228776 RepID=A0ABD1ASP0_CARAN
MHRHRRRNTIVEWPTLFGGSLDLSNLSMIDSGLHKELRDALPVVIFKESFTVKNSRCSVCLENYQEGEKLQQIPACGHAFHKTCIDTWLTSKTTCPLCRVSLTPRVSQDSSHQTPNTVPSMENPNAGPSA